MYIDAKCVYKTRIEMLHLSKQSAFDPHEIKQQYTLTLLTDISKFRARKHHKNIEL